MIKWYVIAALTLGLASTAEAQDIVVAPARAATIPEAIPQHIAATVTAQVIDVYDGDTLTVELDGDRERVRLIGIDAPEVKGNVHGPRARARGWVIPREPCRR